MRKLSADAQTLRNLLCFLDPDVVPKHLLTNAKAANMDPRFVLDHFE
jgi:hypothetical protein